MKKKTEVADFNALKNDLRRGEIARVYVLTGEEDYLADNLVSTILSSVLLPGFEAVDSVRLDGSSRIARPDIDRLEREASTPAFASSKRVVVVRNSGLFAGKAGKASKETSANDDDPDQEKPDRKEGKDASGRLVRLMENLSGGICLIFLEDKVDRRQKSLVDAVQRFGVLAVFERQKPAELVAWLIGICKKSNVSIERKTAENLVDRCDSSMRLIKSEVDKLLLYCASTQTSSIDSPLLDELCVQDIRGSIFDLTDAIAAGGTERDRKSVV